MSLQNLISDTRKPWLTARVSTLECDLGFSVGGSGVITRFEQGSFNALVEGSFITITTPIVIDYQAVGPILELAVPGFSILNGSQNASGVFKITLTDLPGSLNIVDQSMATCVVRTGTGTGLQVANQIYNLGDNAIYMVDGVNLSTNWVKSTGSVGLSAAAVLRFPLQT